jgi:hypothetical protein
MLDFRFGSKADVTLLNFDVRFTPRKQTFAQAIRMSALGQKRTHALQQVKRSANLFVARKRDELSWTSPIEWNVLARISRPLELEVERID